MATVQCQIIFKIMLTSHIFRDNTAESQLCKETKQNTLNVSMSEGFLAGRCIKCDFQH